MQCNFMSHVRKVGRFIRSHIVKLLILQLHSPVDLSHAISLVMTIMSSHQVSCDMLCLSCDMSHVLSVILNSGSIN